MNKEIKEILDEIKDYSEHEYLPPCCELTNEDCKVLLDYITNLEQYYNDNVNKYEELLVKYSTIKRWYDLSKSRIDKAIEFVEQNLEGIGYVEVCDLLNILTGGDEE